MTIIEIILLVAGMAFILASFWITEKLSPGELEHIAELSKEEMGTMLERELEKAKERVTGIVDDTIDASKESTERSLEKQTNEKIMAINEYSDTVIEKMNKTHNEIMFLYSMLNDKHTELTDFTSGLTQQLQDLKAQEEEMTNYYISQLREQKPEPAKPAEPAPARPVGAKPVLTKPVLTKTVSAKPASAKPASAKPASTNSASANPALAKPVAAKPVPAPANPVPAPEPSKADGEPAEKPPQEAPAEPAAPEVEDVPEEEVNVKDAILRLYEEGKDSVAIAKKLGLGVGEVRLILGLYKGG